MKIRGHICHSWVCAFVHVIKCSETERISIGPDLWKVVALQFPFCAAAVSFMTAVFALIIGL